MINYLSSQLKLYEIREIRTNHPLDIFLWAYPSNYNQLPEILYRWTKHKINAEDIMFIIISQDNFSALCKYLYKNNPNPLGRESIFSIDDYEEYVKTQNINF